MELPARADFVNALGDLNPLRCKAACTAWDNLFSIVEGPPGMGKTGTLARLALAWYQLTRQPVLICTFSHTAAETTLRRLAECAPAFQVHADQLAYLREPCGATTSERLYAAACQS